MKYLHLFRLVFISLSVLITTAGCDTPENSKTHYFLNGTDWRQGGYELVIIDADGQAFIITDPKVLQANEPVLRAESRFWLSMLPGASSEKRALYLFQNRRLIKSVRSTIYSHFDTGSLLEHAQALTHNSIYEPKAAYLAQQARLQAQTNVWVFQQSEVQPFQYLFYIDLPTVAVSADKASSESANTDVYQYTVGQQLYERIQADLKQQFGKDNFDISDNRGNLWSSTTPTPYLYRRDGHADDLLRDSNKMVLLADGWTLYNYRIIVSATPEGYRQLQDYDFDRHFAAYRSNNALLQAAVAQQARQARPAIASDQIMIDGYRETTRIGQLHEQKYSLHYFELPQ